MAAKLAPFYHMTHPTKGAVVGPWARIIPSLTRLALDVARVWTGWDESGELAKAVARGAEERGGWELEYWDRSLI